MCFAAVADRKDALASVQADGTNHNLKPGSQASGRNLVTRVTGLMGGQIGSLGSTRAPAHAIRLAATGNTVIEINSPCQPSIIVA